VRPHVAVAGYRSFQHRQCTHNVTLSCVLAKIVTVKKHKRHDFKKKKILNIKFFPNFSTVLSETFLILRRTERGVIKNVHLSTRTVPVIFIRF
jgi:hypothetical protein